MSKILYVSSAVQAALMKEIFIPELMDGFWKNHRPAGHGDVWRDVEVRVSEDGRLGPEGFEVKRNYNFLNLDFALPNEKRLVEVAQSVKANSNFKSVKKELIELGRIVASRLVARDATPVKLYRGNHKPGTVTVSSSRARAAANALADAGNQALAATVETVEGGRQPSGRRVPTAKKVNAVGTQSDVITEVKSKIEVSKTTNGATVRRVPVAASSIFAMGEAAADVGEAE